MKCIIPKELEHLVRPADIHDAANLAWRMRDVDRKECQELGGHTPFKALKAGLEGDFCLSLLDPNTAEVRAMFGVNGNAIWLLADSFFFRSPTLKRLCTKLGRGILSYLFAQQDAPAWLGNITLQENEIVIRWLKWLGAEVASLNQEVAVFHFYKKDFIGDALCVTH